MLQEKLIQAEVLGRLPKVLIVVHMCGQPCEMADIERLSKIYGFKIIEDASHATGAKYRSKPVGSCEYSDISVFSFHPVKIITTGEGGMATTNSQTLNEKLKKFRSHGVTRDKNQFVHKNCEGQQWYYEQQSLGHNYRLSDIQAALGLSQLQKLDDFVARRNELASFYNERLFNTNRIALPKIYSVLSSFHLYTTHRFFQQKRKIELFKHCIKILNLNVHYRPIYTQLFTKLV